MEKRTINTDEYIQQMLGDVDGAYTLSFDTLALLLRTYGKELLLEAVERADVEYNELSEENDKVDKSTILQLIDEL